jgi:hypothetical protein
MQIYKKNALSISLTMLIFLFWLNLSVDTTQYFIGGGRGFWIRIWTTQPNGMIVAHCAKVKLLLKSDELCEGKLSLKGENCAPPLSTQICITVWTLVPQILHTR